MRSIVVLPFNNISGEIDQEDLADGITEDLVAQLSRTTALFVVTRKLSFAYKGHTMKLQQLGLEVGARYVLGGNVRRDGDRVRIVARLMEAATSRQVWADRFERGVADLPEMQDAIVEATALHIAPDLSPFEQQRLKSKPIVSQRVVVGATASGRPSG
jgi:adenylate cyclase